MKEKNKANQIVRFQNKTYRIYSIVQVKVHRRYETRYTYSKGGFTYEEVPAPATTIQKLLFYMKQIINIFNHE